MGTELATAPLAAPPGVGSGERKKKEKRSKALWEKRLPSRDPVLVWGGDLPPAKESSSSVLRCAARAQAPVDPDRAAGGRALKQMEGEKEKREKGKGNGNGETARESAG